MDENKDVEQETTNEPASGDTNKTEETNADALQPQGQDSQPSGQTQTESEETEGTEQSPSRYDERIKELTDSRKIAEEEAEYWRQVSSGEAPNPYETEQSSSPESEGMSEAQKAADMAAQKVVIQQRTEQQMKEAEAAHPELKDNDTFASGVVGAWRAAGGRKTVKQVADELKGLSAQTGERKALTDTANKIAGQAGRARQVAKGYEGFTRESIGKMSPEEYAKNEGAINEALAKGEITE